MLKLQDMHLLFEEARALGYPVVNWQRCVPAIQGVTALIDLDGPPSPAWALDLARSGYRSRQIRLLDYV
jgi:hypothetical protein